MSEIVSWIEDAVREQHLNVMRLPTDDAQKIVDTAKRAFVQGDPSSWWFGLQTSPRHLSSIDLPLCAVIPSSTLNPFFIPETEEKQLPVFRGAAAELERLVGECPFFEFYVVAPDNSWLVIETHHDEYLLCGDGGWLGF